MNVNIFDSDVMIEFECWCMFKTIGRCSRGSRTGVEENTVHTDENRFKFWNEIPIDVMMICLASI